MAREQPTGRCTARSSTRAETGPVIHRAVALLAAFSADRPSLTISEMSRRTGIPLTTVHRLVNSLTEAGFVERDQHGRLHVGLRLWEIATLAPRGLGLREVALPFMEDLFEVTHEHVQLAVREGEEVIFVERLSHRTAIRVFNRVGGRYAMTPTGVGRVLLAYAPPEVQEDVLSVPARQLSPYTVTSVQDLRRMLADVRARGYAITVDQVNVGSMSVAAPVHGSDGSVVAALSVVVRAGSTSSSSLVPLVQTTARGISRSLRTNPVTVLGSAVRAETDPAPNPAEPPPPTPIG